MDGDRACACRRTAAVILADINAAIRAGDVIVGIVNDSRRAAVELNSGIADDDAILCHGHSAGGVDNSQARAVRTKGRTGVTEVVRDAARSAVQQHAYVAGDVSAGLGDRQQTGMRGRIKSIGIGVRGIGCQVARERNRDVTAAGRRSVQRIAAHKCRTDIPGAEFDVDKAYTRRTDLYAVADDARNRDRVIVGCEVNRDIGTGICQ